MKEITLSDYTAEQLRFAAKQRQAAHQRAMADYEAAVLAYEQSQARLITTSAGITRWTRVFPVAWRWILRLIGFRSSRHAGAGDQRRPKPPPPAPPDDREHVWSAGSEGEQRVADLLHQLLPADWTLIRGYKNSGGEIDQIVVSPHGVLAIEVKMLNGTVHCEGEYWWRDKYDQYGNLVERTLPIVDKGGRSPSTQLNAATDKLQQLLHQQLGVSLVTRMIILAHNASRLGELRALSVDCVATVAHLSSPSLFDRLLLGLPTGLVDQRVVEAIQANHIHLNRPRPRRNPTHFHASETRP